MFKRTTICGEISLKKAGCVEDFVSILISNGYAAQIMQSKHDKMLDIAILEVEYTEKAVEIVKKWSEEHHKKTYLMDVDSAYLQKLQDDLAEYQRIGSVDEFRQLKQKQHEGEVEYVNRKELKDVLYRYKRYGAGDEEERIHNDAIDQCIVALNAAPRFNRPRGHWIDSEMLFEPSECSVCRSKMYNPSGAKYCPHCGAEMEEIGEQRSDRVEEDRS